MKQWVQKKYDANLQMIAEQYHITDIFAEILIKRGLYDWEAINGYLHSTPDRLHDPGQMKDMGKAAAILRQKIGEGKKIGIIGDYDVDGVMATVILYLGLKKQGADVVWKIPHRVKDGYGIRSYMAEEMAERGVDTLITCDNGISAVDAVARAKALGMTVIVTDHHETPHDSGTGEELLPPADAVIDPKQRACTYPYKELCGSGVAYKLVEALWGRGFGESLRQRLLPFAAIATVCDVVPLTGENRVIVKIGLDLLQRSDNAGLAALIGQLGFQREIRSDDLGFRIGPCINAAGRLGDASLVVGLFLEQDKNRAEETARRLIALNEERKEMTAGAVRDAVEVIEREGYLESPVLVVYLEECQESVAGIVAGRIREQYFRPVMVVTRSGNCLKGSGRSIPGYHMQKALNRCSGLLLEYGGHAMAAGFSLTPDNLDGLRAALNRECGLKEADFVEKVTFDREVALGEVNKTLIGELELLQPTGERNPGALFARRSVEVCSVRVFGREEQIGRFQAREDGEMYWLVDFNIHLHMKKTICERYSQQAWEELLSGGASYQVDILYEPGINARYGDIEYRVVDCR